MFQDLYTNLVVNFGLGLLVGCYGTLVGAGGGFVLVPIFLLLFKMSPELAAGTSLVIVASNACSGASGYIKRGKVDYRAGISFALATIPGAILGARFTEYFSGPAFMRVFGIFLMLISLYLFFIKAKLAHRNPVEKLGWCHVRRMLKEEHYSYNEPLGLGISVGVGAFSSWLGIGGGILHVPAMTEILGFPVHIAVATSHFVLAITALVGALAHGYAGHIDYQLAISTGAGAILGAQVGVYLSPRFKGSVILRYLSLALFVVGIKLIIS